MTKNLAILLWATDPERAHQCATPFSHAAAAAAMDVNVEVYFTSRSVRLLVRGVADGMYAAEDSSKSIYGFMCNAAEMGAKFFACPDAIAAYRVEKATLIPECAGFAGSAAFMSRALDDAWKVLVY
jgi:uncharacterized protein